MSSSYCNLLYHIIFSTKGREPWLTSQVRSRVHQYLGGAIRDEKGIALIVNGTADHIHILAKFRQDKAISKLVGEVKANSSGWISRTFTEAAGFAWQEGYGAFTVSESQMPKVRRYIERQEEHHRTISFLEELKVLLKAHGLPFDERYL
ncbi:MAG TPA: IS200/IS605 family transposase [Chthoniobacterales bacterium]|nr:IS200/IS605 family transposase [Chthoniobacterales bacterium]